MQRSIKALRGLGDWTEDPHELGALPYSEMGKRSRPAGLYPRGDWGTPAEQRRGSRPGGQAKEAHPRPSRGPDTPP